MEQLSTECEYYAAALILVMSGQDKKGWEITELVDAHDFGAFGPFDCRNAALVEEAVEWLERQKLGKIWRDKYGPDMFKLEADVSLSSAASSTSSQVLERVMQLGTRWLEKALQRLNQKSGEMSSLPDELPFEAAAVDDSWEPLPLDREAKEYEEVVSSVKEAIAEVGKNNGYANDHPEERNAVLELMKGTLNAIKLGMPTMASIKAGLIAPLKRVAKVFSKTAIEQLAKRAIDALFLWLATFGL